MKPEDEHTPEVEETTPTDGDASPTPAPAPEKPAQASADALSKTPDELEEEAVEQAASEIDTVDEPVKPKKFAKLRQFFRRFNPYFLLFILLVIIVGAIAIVSYLNDIKEPEAPNIATQELSQEALQQLATTNASVGSASQTLTIQGNAIIDGQTLMRGNLNVAGNFQSGGSIQGSGLTISGTSNLGETQINGLQVANNLAVEGDVSMRDLNVAGASTFSGAMTASDITVTRLTLSGNAVLQISNHIRIVGPSPGRTINPGVLGSGGTASVSGSDTAGTVNVSTGNGPQAGCFAQINFNQRYTNQPRVIVSPIGTAAGQTQYYVTRTNDNFSLCTAAPAPANQTFAFDYFVTN